MAESRRYPLAAQLDIEQILLEAQHRWLHPAEICEILRNYQKFRIASEPPNRPPTWISMVQYPEARDQYRRLLNVVSEMQETKAVYDRALDNSDEAAEFDEDLIDLDALLDDDLLMSWTHCR